MKSLTLKLCSLWLLAASFAAAQQGSPYPSSSSYPRNSSSSDNSQFPNWPASTPQGTQQLPVGTQVQIPQGPTNTGVTPATIPAPSLAVGMAPLTTRITAAPVELGPGDLMDITVLDALEVSGRFRVNAAGEITMPLIGVVPVRGLSPEQAQTLIAKKLVDGNFIKDPQVTVFVSEYASQMVYVLGEVKMPGAYPLMGSHRLLDFVSAAGGLTPNAANEAKITRTADPDHPVTLSLKSGDAKDNPEMHPGDSISVEQAGLVYVLGDVNRPGSFLMDRHEQITVLRALALAQGPSPTAKLSKAKLVRTTNNERTTTDLNLKKMLKGGIDDPPVQEGDILYVPSGEMVKRGFDAVLLGATTAAIYAAHP
jgi:polysaccharide biosynthesis/export protein